MLHKFFEEGDWFAAKKLGYGAGLPIAWQGWAFLLGFLAIVIGIGVLIDGGTLVEMAIGIGLIVLLTIPFVMVVKRRTRGGWKWRP